MSICCCDMRVKTLSIPFNAILVLYLVLHSRIHGLQNSSILCPDTKQRREGHAQTSIHLLWFFSSTPSNRELSEEEDFGLDTAFVPDHLHFRPLYLWSSTSTCRSCLRTHNVVLCWLHVLPLAESPFPTACFFFVVLLEENLIHSRLCF